MEDKLQELASSFHHAGPRGHTQSLAWRLSGCTLSQAWQRAFSFLRSALLSHFRCLHVCVWPRHPPVLTCTNTLTLNMIRLDLGSTLTSPPLPAFPISVPHAFLIMSLGLASLLYPTQIAITEQAASLPLQVTSKSSEISTGIERCRQTIMTV